MVSPRGIASVRAAFEQAEQAVNSSKKIIEREYTVRHHTHTYTYTYIYIE